MPPVVSKKELTHWINQLDDESMLHLLQSIKDSHTTSDWWNGTPERVKKGIRKAEADVEAGRLHSSDEVYSEIHRRRIQRA